MRRFSAAWITAPAVLLLGFASGWASGSGSAWFDTLRKPGFMPPDWAFPAAWTALYLLIGTAYGWMLDAPPRRDGGKRRAAVVFLAQLALNLAWSPVFFGLHRTGEAMVIIALMIPLTALAVALFSRVRTLTGWMLLPYLAWLFFAAALNAEILRLNP